MRNLTLILVAFNFFYSISAKEYHVAKTGNDHNKGTIESPFLNIQKAANILQAGDVVTVHEGIYREMIVPKNGGSSDIARIVYQAAPGEHVVVKGSEIVDHWEKTEEGLWKAVVPNTLFGDYNPFADQIEGDWFLDKGRIHHTGEVYLNGKSLFEKSTVADVVKSEVYPDARNPEASTYTWYAEVGAESTSIWANFQKNNPNEEEVEINVRRSCFYPAHSGIDFISIRGFTMTQAATQWAAPTAEQIALIGTNWSKGWIIEDNIISNSKCVGISLGKDRSTGHNVWMHNSIKDGSAHYNEVIFRALEIGWSKEKIGSHIVRNNTIFDCEQAGIVGSLGAVFSTLSGNHIYDIWTKRQFYGYEIAGIKIHASIDMLIENNCIHNVGRGLWIDWMAQGVRISRNIFYDNTTDDLFSEVNHGPYLFDNNIALSETPLRIWSEGGAFVHNLLLGQIVVRQVFDRFTPYHLPHSTSVKGLQNTRCGDDRYYNNVFIAVDKDYNTDHDTLVSYGLSVYDEFEGFENHYEGNVFYNDAVPGKKDKNFVRRAFKPDVKMEEREDGFYLLLTLDDAIEEANTIIAKTEILGTTIISQGIFDDPQGESITVDKDYFENARNIEKPTAGPFENIKTGKVELKVWKKPN